MSASDDQQGTSASNPIDLLSSSPDDRRIHSTASSSSAPPTRDVSVAERGVRHTVRRPRPKRDPDSSEGDTDSDLSIRRTRAFRSANRRRSSSHSAHSMSRSTPQAVGTSAIPIVVGEPQEQARPTQPRPSGSRITHEHTEGERRSYFANDHPTQSPTSAETGQTISRRPSQANSSTPAHAHPRLPRLPSVVLPRWQPDNEVTYCPICHTQFSFFVRKHHCRKCGRVVCDACSPHRITIPYQYIVQPPGTPRIPRAEYPTSLIAGEGRYSDFSGSGLGGGERVRLCNPCVPDPNITPPQVPARDAASSSTIGHARSQSSVQRPPAAGQSPLINRLSAYMGAYSQTPEQYVRSRSVTMGNHSTPVTPGAQPLPSLERPQQPRRAPASARPYRASAVESSPVLVTGSSVPSSSRAHTSRALPAVPQPSQPRRYHQIPEEDECPVCHRELPPRTLPDFEARREEHITSCIMSHSGTPTQRGAAAVPSPGESSTPQRRTGMFPYKATEKDCVDSAECTICLEEFEVGVDMARLECLCRFHRRCINAWFEKHPGQCPMHQHDGFGF